MNNEYKQATIQTIKVLAFILTFIAVMSALVYHFGTFALIVMQIVFGIVVLIGGIWFISLTHIEQSRRK